MLSGLRGSISGMFCWGEVVAGMRGVVGFGWGGWRDRVVMGRIL